MTKRCPNCKRTLEVVINVTFNRKAAAADELQPWCRECDYANKPRPENGWTNFRKKLRDRGQREERFWTHAAYLALMEEHKWACRYCGSDVSVWGSGYWVDKIDPTRPYKPDNCLPCCWPCNCQKSDGKGGVYAGYVAGLVATYGWGRVPWQVLNPRFRRIDEAIPDLSEYVHPEPETQMSLFDQRGPELDRWR